MKTFDGLAIGDVIFTSISSTKYTSIILRFDSLNTVFVRLCNVDGNHHELFFDVRDVEPFKFEGNRGRI